MSLTRRSVLRTGLLAAASPLLNTVGAAAFAQSAQGGEKQWRHGLSLFGTLRYPPGFKHFEYVNPAAPKAGLARMIAIGTFDNLNLVVAGVRGSLAAGVSLIYDTLMTSSMDEVSTGYGLLAEAVSNPADFSSVTYRLRSEAKWHDGKPVTPDDVIFSFGVFKKHYPQLAAYYRHVLKAEQTGEREVTFTFDRGGNRELPQIVGELNVLPKHWWEGKDANGKPRNVAGTTLEIPLGNGAYRIKDFTPGRSITYERVAGYWGKDLNVNIGSNNFNELRYEYFRDPTVALEAFKADDVDWRTESSAKNWATAYDFPAVKEKRVILEEFPINSFGIMQAFVFNTRREKFKDPRVREAINYAFNFEEMNRAIFFGQYKRIASYFDGLELASSGLPQGRELEILETVRAKVPPEVFTKVYTNPINDDRQAVRANLRHAIGLLKQAGYVIRNQKLVNAKTGEPMTIEFLIDQPTFERVVLFFKPSLERLGIGVTVRRVDDVQYQNRLRNWDYDIIVASWGQSLSPGNEQRAYWGSQAADTSGSRNMAGIKNPAIDALVDQVIYSKNRDDLVAATKALDRVLLWNHYVVPQWTYGKVRTARWDRFSHPDVLPKYGLGAFPNIWWWDEAKAAKLKA